MESIPNNKDKIAEVRAAIDTALQLEREGQIAEALEVMDNAYTLAIQNPNSTREIIDEIRDHKDRLEETLFPPQPERQLEY